MKNIKNYIIYKKQPDPLKGLMCTVQHSIEYEIGRGSGYRYRYVYNRLEEFFGRTERGVL